MASAVAEPPAKAAAQQQDPEKSESRKRKAAGPLEVHVIGLSHHNAAVEVREKLSIPEANWNAASNALCESGQWLTSLCRPLV
jgi:glutamyl-tRNA reductase